MITDKELKILLDKAHAKLKDKFDYKANLFLERINHKIKRFKKLNEVEEKRLKEIAGG